MANTAVSRPYIRYQPEVRPAQSGQVGFDKHANIRIKLAGAAFHDIICVVSWNEDRKLIGKTTSVETTVTKADVAVHKASLGWSTLEELPGDTGSTVKWSGRIIRFEKRFMLQVSVNPVLEAVPMLNKADVTNSWLTEIHGFIDVASRTCKAELVYL